jgi:gingipain R
MIVLLCALAVLNGFNGEWHSLGGEYRGQAAATPRDYSSEGVSIDLSVPGFGMVPENGHTRLVLPGFDWNTDLAPGSPELPVVPLAIGIPAGMGARVASIEATWTPVGVFTIHPVQPLGYDSDLQPPAFVELSGDLQGVHPSEAAVLSAPQTLFGLNTARLLLNPFRWNPRTGLLEAAATMTVNIAFDGSQGVQTPVIPERARMLSSLVLNFDLMEVPVNLEPITQDDVVYIVITVEENLPEITPLLSMVNLMGHRVVIEVLPLNSTPAVIKAAIQSHFHAETTRFVLIAATHQQLPSFNFGTFYGDYYYQTLDGDNLPDIVVGRFPAGAGNLANMIDKSMSYSTFTGTPGMPSIPATTMLCAHEEEYPSKYTANKNAIKNWDYTIIDPLFETFFPPEGATQQQVQDRINAGVGTVNYRGHGSVTTWQWSPGWNAGAIYALTNTFFPPVFNVACDNGAHDKTYNCLCESWLYALGKGASATCGASAPSATVVNHRFDRVLYWQLYDEGNTCGAETHAAAQTEIVTMYGESGLSNARMYHWFGDPSLDIFNCDETGSPFPLVLSCPSHAFHGENTLTVSVASQGSPVAGAVVTITDGIGNHPEQPETFYVQAITDASGEAELTFNAQGDSELMVGARMHNMTPAFDTIQTWSEGIEGSTPDFAVLLPASPNPSASLVQLGMDIASPGFYTMSVVDLAGRVVEPVTSGVFDAGQYRFQHSTEGLVPGLYFVVLQGNGLSESTRMMVVGR